MSSGSLQESLGKLLELSYKGYAEEQASLLTAMDTLATASTKFTTDEQYAKALSLAGETMNKVRGTANEKVADAYNNALQDSFINFETDKSISQSIGASEAAIAGLMDEYKTSEMQDILGALHKVAGEYRGNASAATMGKLQSQIKRAHDIADLAEEFKKYDSQKTVYHEAPELTTEQVEAMTLDEYEAYQEDYLTSADPKGSFVTGEGIQLKDEGLRKAYNKLSRLDLKGATIEFDKAEKAYVEETWSGSGRVLSSVISRANSHIAGVYDKDVKYQAIPTEGLANLDPLLLKQTEENINNALVDFIEKHEGIREYEGKLGNAYKADGVRGLAAEMKKQMDAKSTTDPSFAIKTDYAKIKYISGSVNWNDWGWGGEVEANNAFASLMESMYEIGKVEANISAALNLDIF